MRVSDSMIGNQVRENVGKNRTEMSNLQNQAATQKRVTKPSDDPVASARVLGARLDLRGNEQFRKNTDYVQSFLEFTDQSLNELTEQIMRAKELALSQANDPGAGPQSRRAVATEVGQMFDQMVAIGNRKLGERYIFGGYKTTTRPFDESGKYAGDDGDILVHVDKDSFVAMNMPGSRVFLGKDFSSSGRIKAIENQPNSIEELKEQIAKEQQAKAKENPTEFSENPEVQLRGPASINSNGIDEEVQRSVNSSETNGIDIFKAVKNLEISLRTNDKAGIQASLDDLDESLNQIVVARAQVGARSSVLKGALDTLHQQKVDTQGSISQFEDADIFQVVSDINKTETALQATMQTSGKLMPKSLLDFIR